MKQVLLANKLKTSVLAVLMALGVMTTSCGDDQSAKEAEKMRQEVEKALKEAADKRAQQLKAEKDGYFEHVNDSIKEANGALKISEELHSLPEIYKDETEIERIEYSKTLGGVMEKDVKEAVFGIVVDYMLQVNDLLEKHHLPRFYTGDTEGVIYGLLRRVVYDEYAKGKMMDIQHHNPLDSISNVSDLSQEEIDKIASQLKKMDSDIKKKISAAKKAVEKRYTDYYVTEDPNSLGFEDLGDGSWEFGYAGLNDTDYVNPEVLIIRKTINVYDQNLNENFFNEEGASYKLIDLGNHKWQVEKKRKNGTTVKTKVFQDNKEYEELYGHKTREEAKNVVVGQKTFSFEPGAHKGVRVYYSEVVEIQKRKDWKPAELSDAEKKVVDSLKNEIARKRQMSNEKSALEKDAYKRAIEMVKARYGSYER